MSFISVEPFFMGVYAILVFVVAWQSCVVVLRNELGTLRSRLLFPMANLTNTFGSTPASMWFEDLPRWWGALPLYLIVTSIVLPFRASFNLIVGGIALMSFVSGRFHSSRIGDDLRLRRRIDRLHRLRVIREMKLDDLTRVEREIEALQTELEQPQGEPFRGPIPALQGKTS